MSPAVAVGILLLTSLGTRIDDTMTRALEADARLLAGKWVLKNPPAGWERVELIITRNRDRLTLDITAIGQGACWRQIFEDFALNDHRERRSIRIESLTVRYTLRKEWLRLEEPVVGRMGALISRGGVATASPTFDGE